MICRTLNLDRVIEQFIDNVDQLVIMGPDMTLALMATWRKKAW